MALMMPLKELATSMKMGCQIGWIPTTVMVRTLTLTLMV